MRKQIECRGDRRDGGTGEGEEEKSLRTKPFNRRREERGGVRRGKGHVK